MSWTYRVKHGNVRIFSGSTIHWGGFLNSKSTGNARIQLYVHKKSYSRAEFNNRYFKDYDFSNITAEQLKLYNFEQSNELLDTCKHPFAPANNNDQCSVSHGNNGKYYSGTFQDSQSSFSKHKDKTIHCEKGNNAEGNFPRLLIVEPSSSS